MSKFDYMIFTGGESEQFVVHANKYTKEEAIDLAKQEVFFCVNNGRLMIINDITEDWCRYYIRVPDWCNYNGDSNSGCYSFCNQNERGAFPVWVVTI